MSILGKVDWLAIQNKAFSKNVNFVMAEKGNGQKMLVQMYLFFTQFQNLHNEVNSFFFQTE